MRALNTEGLSFDEIVEQRITAMWGSPDSSHAFIHSYDVQGEWKLTMAREAERLNGSSDVADVTAELSEAHL